MNNAAVKIEWFQELNMNSNNRKKKNKPLSSWSLMDWKKKQLKAFLLIQELLLPRLYGLMIAARPRLNG